MDTISQWLQDNKWLTLSDHFFDNYSKRVKPKNNLHTLAGIWQEVDDVWDKIYHNQYWMDEYINRCDLQNVLFKKYILDVLKARLNKLEMKLRYKSEALMGNNTTDLSGAISKAKEYPMQEILEKFGCKVRLNRCACPIHGGKNNSSFVIKSNYGRCHSCLWSGDSIELYRELSKVDFVTAVKELQA